MIHCGAGWNMIISVLQLKKCISWFIHQYIYRYYQLFPLVYLMKLNIPWNIMFKCLLLFLIACFIDLALQPTFKANSTSHNITLSFLHLARTWDDSSLWKPVVMLFSFQAFENVYTQSPLCKSFNNVWNSSKRNSKLYSYSRILMLKYG